MANVVATNFGEFSTTAADFFENISQSGTSFAAAPYTSSSVFGYAGGNGQAYQMTNNGPTVTKTVPSASEYFARIKCCFQTASQQFIMRFDETATNHVYLQWNADGTLSALRNGTVLATGATVYPRLNTTVLDVQIRVVIHDTTGVFQVKAFSSGVGSATALEINFSGDTRNGGTGIINRIGFSMTSGVTMYFSDFVVNDTTGSSENSWPGPVRVVLSKPSADGGSGVQWTPLSSTNVSNIDDTIPGAHDVDVTYNEDSTAGHKDYFTTWGSFSGMSPSSIHFVVTKCHIRSADGGAHTARTLAKNGGTNVNGATVALGATYGLIEDRYYNDPATSAAWASFSAIAAAEFGYELVS